MTLIREKIEQACEILKELQIDCWLTFVRETQINGDPMLPYLVNADLTWHSALIVRPSGGAIAIVGAYDKKTVEDTGAYEDVIGYVEGIKPDLLRIMAVLSPRSIAVNYSRDSEVCDGLTHGMFLTLAAMLSEINLDGRLVSAQKIVSALRQRKTPGEISRIQKAIAATETVFESVGSFIRAGRTEEEVAAFVRKQVESARLQLAWEPRVCPAVFTGPDSAEAHYAPTDRIIEPGHIVNMDFGVKVAGYCADLQRSFYIARDSETSCPPDVRAGFDTVIRVIECARRCLKPGRLGFEVDRLARQIVMDAGFRDFPHALGHQVGRFAHDGTAILGPAWEKYAQKPFEPIEKGMVFTLEPRLLVPGRGVVTIEEMVLVTDNGAEYLSQPQQDVRMIKA